MSYRQYVNKRNPVASFILDDPVPFFDNSGIGNAGGKKTGTSDPTTATALVAGAAYSSVFNATSVGQFTFASFKQGMETRGFALEAWILPIPKTSTGPQQILSHSTMFDGLSINGEVIKFSTMYTTAPEAAVAYDLQGYRAAHVVAIHNKEQNQLWVNNKLVAAIDLTDEQKADTYPVWADDQLYCGYTTSTQELAVNGIAFYNSLSGEQINQNYQAGTNVVPQARVIPQYDGIALNMNGVAGSRYIERTWAERADFNLGLKNNVEYSPEAITPAFIGDTSVAGSWTTAVPLDTSGATSIYGVMVDWSGEGINVDVSLNGTSWTAATPGTLISIIPNGYNPTGKDLQIRVSFPGGIVGDTSYLESLIVIAYKDNTLTNITTRPITVSYPAVLRNDYEPIFYRDDNGVSLHGGTLTIGADTSTDPNVARTLEVWIKPLSGTPTISVTGTKYRNGVADSTMPVGQWQLIHIVSAADVTTDITITGDCIVGQVALYPTALTAAQILQLYSSYTGVATIRISDSVSPIGASEQAVPVTLYASDWSITSGG
jgi:hypothetical protein